MNRLAALLLSASFATLSLGQESAKPPAKPDVKKDEPKKEPAKSDDDDVHKTAERIAENAKKAGDRLKEKDPGEATRKIQQEIVKDIDSLIEKAQEPPPPMNSDMSPMMPPPKSDMPPPKSDMMPPPMGGMPMPKSGTGGMPPPKMGNSGGGASGSQPNPGRRPRRERKERGGSPMGDPMAKAGNSGMQPMPANWEPKAEPKGNDGKRANEGEQFGKPSPKRENDKLAELYKDVWGHLPERLRQEMDLYYREQFMPRYSELLRQYYASLAEQRKKGSEDR